MGMIHTCDTVDPNCGRTPCIASGPFRQHGRRNSWDGGWRTLGFYVERLDGWWWRKKWAVKMDYSDRLGSTRGQVCSRHKTMVEANMSAAATWDDIEADHARITEYEATR
jgi:hypothetical protein